MNTNNTMTATKRAGLAAALMVAAALIGLAIADAADEPPPPATPSLNLQVPTGKIVAQPWPGQIAP